MRDSVNRITGFAPAFMSLAAFAIVILAVSTGWERGATDEGAAAHLFQLLIVLQTPLIAIFLLSARWSGVRRVAKPIAFQIGALVLALGSVAYFRL